METSLDSFREALACFSFLWLDLEEVFLLLVDGKDLCRGSPTC